MTRQYWIGIVSKEHVERGKLGGFAQVCHGKCSPLNRMRPGDILMYYSPQITLGEKSPYQCFTALGIVEDKPPYQVEMTPDFQPFRRDIYYLQTIDAPIKPLLLDLSFIQDKIKWGANFRFGILKIPQEDFVPIAKAMQLSQDKINDLLR